MADERMDTLGEADSAMVGRTMKRVPLTAAIVVAMMVAGIATDTVWRRMSPAALLEHGFAARDLLGWPSVRIVSSVFLTWGGMSFAGVVLLVVAMVGVCEWRLGSTVTGVVFVTTHLAAELLELGLGLAFGWESLIAAPDVGPSAGCFGCVGAWIAQQSTRSQWIAAAGLVAFLLAIGFWREDPGLTPMTLFASDLSHPVAAMVGWWVGRRVAAHRSNTPPDPLQGPVTK